MSNSHLLAGNPEMVLAINAFYDLIVLNPILAQLDPFPACLKIHHIFQAQKTTVQPASLFASLK